MNDSTKVRIRRLSTSVNWDGDVSRPAIIRLYFQYVVFKPCSSIPLLLDSDKKISRYHVKDFERTHITETSSLPSHPERNIATNVRAIHENVSKQNGHDEGHSCSTKWGLSAKTASSPIPTSPASINTQPLSMSCIPSRKSFSCTAITNEPHSCPLPSKGVMDADSNLGASSVTSCGLDSSGEIRNSMAEAIQNSIVDSIVEEASESSTIHARSPTSSFYATKSTRSGSDGGSEGSSGGSSFHVVRGYADHISLARNSVSSPEQASTSSGHIHQQNRSRDGDSPTRIPAPVQQVPPSQTQCIGIEVQHGGTHSFLEAPKVNQNTSIDEVYASVSTPGHANRQSRPSTPQASGSRPSSSRPSRTATRQAPNSHPSSSQANPSRPSSTRAPASLQHPNLRPTTSRSGLDRIATRTTPSPTRSRGAHSKTSSFSESSSLAGQSRPAARDGNRRRSRSTGEIPSQVARAVYPNGKATQNPRSCGGAHDENSNQANGSPISEPAIFSDSSDASQRDERARQAPNLQESESDSDRVSIDPQEARPVVLFRNEDGYLGAFRAGGFEVGSYQLDIELAKILEPTNRSNVHMLSLPAVAPELLQGSQFHDGKMLLHINGPWTNSRLQLSAHNFIGETMVNPTFMMGTFRLNQMPTIVIKEKARLSILDSALIDLSTEMKVIRDAESSPTGTIQYRIKVECKDPVEDIFAEKVMFEIGISNVSLQPTALVLTPEVSKLHLETAPKLRLKGTRGPVEALFKIFRNADCVTSPFYLCFSVPCRFDRSSSIALPRIRLGHGIAMVEEVVLHQPDFPHVAEPIFSNGLTPWEVSKVIGDDKNFVLFKRREGTGVIVDSDASRRDLLFARLQELRWPKFPRPPNMQRTHTITGHMLRYNIVKTNGTLKCEIDVTVQRGPNNDVATVFAKGWEVKHALLDGSAVIATFPLKPDDPEASLVSEASGSVDLVVRQLTQGCRPQADGEWQFFKARDGKSQCHITMGFELSLDSLQEIFDDALGCGLVPLPRLQLAWVVTGALETNLKGAVLRLRTRRHAPQDSQAIFLMPQTPLPLPVLDPAYELAIQCPRIKYRGRSRWTKHITRYVSSSVPSPTFLPTLYNMPEISRVLDLSLSTENFAALRDAAHPKTSSTSKKEPNRLKPNLKISGSGLATDISWSRKANSSEGSLLLENGKADAETRSAPPQRRQKTRGLCFWVWLLLSPLIALLVYGAAENRYRTWGWEVNPIKLGRERHARENPYFNATKRSKPSPTFSRWEGYPYAPDPTFDALLKSSIRDAEDAPGQERLDGIIDQVLADMLREDWKRIRERERRLREMEDAAAWTAAENVVDGKWMVDDVRDLESSSAWKQIADAASGRWPMGEADRKPSAKVKDQKGRGKEQAYKRSGLKKYQDAFDRALGWTPEEDQPN